MCKGGTGVERRENRVGKEWHMEQGGEQPETRRSGLVAERVRDVKQDWQ